MSDPVVELQSGQIRGFVEKHEDGFDYYAFKGISYAEPPIGDLRFEDPIPIKKWTGILDCKNYGPVGCSFDFIAETLHLDENCLHLNVFTRAINEASEKKAVIVWIPFGNFAFCNASDLYFGPDHLIRKNIVLVTVNFRTSVLGFLDLEDEVAPGNQGLKDLAMALQWVQQNIQMFGGDPGNVTVGGNTQGGVAAHFLALSPLTKGLMHKTISHGAALYNHWITVMQPKANAIKLCSLLGKDSQDSEEIKSFLKTVSTVDLMAAYDRLWRLLNKKPFGPGIDSKSSNPFMPIDRYIAADQGVQLPSLVGHNNRSGTMILLDYLSFKDVTRAEFFAKADHDFRTILNYNAQENLQYYNLNSAEQLKRLYYGNESVTESNLDKYVDFASDVHLDVAVHRFVRVQAERSSAPTYMYQFKYHSPDAFHHLYKKNVPEGASLFDEVPYLFKMGIFEQRGIKNFEKGTRSYRIMEQMTEMWTNFAIQGRPTIETSELIPVYWKPISDGTLLRYMNIDEDLTMQYTINLEDKLISARQIKA